MRERRYICGRNRKAAQYQEVEIYPLPTRDGRGRDLDRENAKPPSFRGTPKAQANHNAKNARRRQRNPGGISATGCAICGKPAVLPVCPSRNAWP